MKNIKGFIDCFCDFMADPENLTLDEIKTELKDIGIDSKKFEEKTKEMIKRLKRSNIHSKPQTKGHT